MLRLTCAALLISLCITSVSGFIVVHQQPSPLSKHSEENGLPTHLSQLTHLASTNSDETANPSEEAKSEATLPDDGVVELLDVDEKTTADSTGPQGPLFISQGELDPQALNPDFSDAKQTRVLIYTIISLLPVLFLIPFMLSREFIPQDIIPPVEM